MLELECARPLDARARSIPELWGHLQTMWIIFWVFLTPPSPHVDYRGFFANPPYKPCGFFPTPPFRFKNFKEYIIS